MDDALLRGTAAFIAHDFLKAHPELAAEALRPELAALVETALRSVVRQERELCAAACDSRKELWSRTEANLNAPAQLRAEARARANEAAVIADAIRAR